MKKLLVVGIAATAFCGAPALAEPPSDRGDWAGRAFWSHYNISTGDWDWSGFYIGVNGGGMNFTTNGYNTEDPVVTWRTDRHSTSIAGLHGGFQGQWGNWVVGIEGAWEGALSSSFGSRDAALGANPCIGNSSLACQARINDILTVGPRVGFAMNQWMVYGTGGYARAEIQSQYFDMSTGGPFGLERSNHHDGWYYGGGLEFLVTNNFIVGVEYKHYDFSSAVHLDTGGDSTTLKASAEAVLLRLTLKQ
jgi:outer membrane immunogenic protein